MNWTTTTVPLWQIDCDNFRRVGKPFELRDATTPEHDAFVDLFCARYGLKSARKGTTVCMEPEKTSEAGPSAPKKPSRSTK
jgi:hypothetical protein